MFQGVVPKDIVNLIVNYFPDGQTAAWFGATCQRFHEVVHKNYKAKKMMEMHLIWTENLEQTLPVEADTPLFSEVGCNKLYFTKLLASILYFNHRFNIFLLDNLNTDLYRYNCSTNFCLFLRYLIEPGLKLGHHEAFRMFADGAGNFVLCSDFYGCDIFGRNYSAPYAEIQVEFFQWLQTFFPGTFTWRFINFPRAVEQYAFNSEFHRGTSLQLIFKSHGFAVPHPDILRVLKKQQVLPKRYYKAQPSKKRAKPTNERYSIPFVTPEERFWEERSKFIKE